MPKPNNLTMNPGNLPPGPSFLPNNKYGCTDEPDGSIVMMYKIPPEVVKKLKVRAGSIPLDRYIYEQIAYRNTIDFVY